MALVKKYARLFIGLVCVCLFSDRQAVAGERWVVYENCRLLENEFNDGDSFHVACGRKHRIFRLYFVDAPETSNEYPDRVKEQAEYFGIRESDALKAGKAATRFTATFLSRGFTVYTKREDARGNSKLKRYFAMVKVGETWLSEELVGRGLARIYGLKTDLPGGLPARKYVADLNVRERAAQRKKKGAWKMRDR